MKLYVEERDMPKNCMNCPCGAVYFAYSCKAEQKEFEKYPFDGRQDWCPLIPVPPHGDLIERDAIPFVESENGCQDDYAFRYDINEMPVIIPAEEGET